MLWKCALVCWSTRSSSICKERHPDWYREDLLHLMVLLSQGKIAPLVAERLHLREARHAQELLGKGMVTSSIVLLYQEPAPS